MNILVRDGKELRFIGLVEFVPSILRITRSRFGRSANKAKKNFGPDATSQGRHPSIWSEP